MPLGTKIPFKQSNYNKSLGFAMGALKRYPELNILGTFIGFGAAMAAAFTFYSLYQKPDVRVYKGEEVAPWDRVDYSKSQKFLSFNQKWEKVPEVESLKGEIGPQKWR